MMTSNTHPAREPASPYLRAWPLWVASVLVPLLFLGVVAYRCWQLERDEVYSGVARTAETLSAYTLRTFEAQDSLLAAVDSFTAGMRWDEIASSTQLTAFMRELDNKARNSGGIGVVSPAGRFLHHSRAPAILPEVDLSDWDQARIQRAARGDGSAGEIIVGRVNKQPVFSYSRPRRDRDGRPDGGLFWATFPPDVVLSLYRSIVETPDDVLALVREDGEILASYPPLGDSDARRLAPGSIPMQVMSTVSDNTVVSAGPWPSDGLHRVFAVRRVGRLPVVVIYGLHPAEVWQEWFQHVSEVGVVTVVAMAALLLVTWHMARRVQHEQAALQRERAEAEARADIEGKLRHGQRLEVLGRVAAEVAHDFRNVVHVVQNSADVARSLLAAGNATQASAVMGVVSDVAQRGDGLARRVLGLARRGEAGTGDVTDPQPGIADPVAVVRTVCDFAGRVVGAGYLVQSHIQAHGPPQYVRGPNVELEAALLNLVFNARDAMTEGGEVVIAVAAEIVAAGDHHPAGLAPGVYARISVADTGIGMDAATLAQAAEPFFTTKGPGRGTGLGLSTTRSFVEAAGGGFRIESPGLGCGSTVTVWLPEADAAAVDAQRLSESRVGQPNR